MSPSTLLVALENDISKKEKKRPNALIFFPKAKRNTSWKKLPPLTKTKLPEMYKTPLGFAFSYSMYRRNKVNRSAEGWRKRGRNGESTL